MKLFILFAVSLMLFVSTACERTGSEIDEATNQREVAPATEPREGPAERTGRVVDDAARRTAETVGRGLEEAGEEIREHVPEPEPERR